MSEPDIHEVKRQFADALLIIAEQKARIKKLEAAIKLHRQVHSSPDISADWFDGRLWKALESDG
jgi:hypothetical protein